MVAQGGVQLAQLNEGSAVCANAPNSRSEHPAFLETF